MEFNYADLFEGITDAIPHRPALIAPPAVPPVGSPAAEPVRLTYAELDAHANRLAHHLLAVGVRPGEHVGVQLYNGLEYVATLLAALKIRAVPINVNYRYVSAELADLYADADLVVLVHDVEFAAEVRPAAARSSTLRHLIEVGGTPPVDAGALSERTVVEYAAALAGQPSGRDFPPRTGDDLYIIYTGGTTGPPKGAMWRQRDLFFAFGGGKPGGPPPESPREVIERAAGSGPRVTLPAAPLIHGAGQMTTFLTFWAGGTNVYVRRFDAAEVVGVIERERVTSINIVGDAMARPIAEEIAAGRHDVSSLFAVTSTGAILSSTVRARLRELLPDTVIVDAFGSTESGLAAVRVIDAGGPGADAGADTGQGAARAPITAAPRYRARDESVTVLGADLEPVSPGSGQVGQVARNGPISFGYYKDADKTARTHVDVAGTEWLLTGDLATIEPDGTIAVLGRGSQCVNTGGEKVYVEEVEAALKTHPGVFDALVTGVPDERYGERVVAVLRPYAHDAGASGLEPGELDHYLRKRLAGYKVPRDYVFVAEVRRTPAGKADYRWARDVAVASTSASTRADVAGGSGGSP